MLHSILISITLLISSLSAVALSHAVKSTKDSESHSSELHHDHMDLSHSDENDSFFDLPEDPTDWTLDAESDQGYYFSKTANLYFDRSSGHFFDPETEQWFDPERNEWYPHSNRNDGGAEENVGELQQEIQEEDLPVDHTDWLLDEESGLYWSETAQLFFDRSNGHFYDPQSEQWYDSERAVWYTRDSL